MNAQKTSMQRFCNDLDISHEGLIIASKDGEQFHAMPSGEPAYSQRYECAEYFQNGLAWVKEKGGRWKRIDKTGKETKSE